LSPVWELHKGSLQAKKDQTQNCAGKRGKTTNNLQQYAFVMNRVKNENKSLREEKQKPLASFVRRIN
jgi:hypothetical protein